MALSERIRDESKLDRAIPYLCLFLDEYIEGAFHQQEGPQTASKVVCGTLFIDYTFNVVFLYQSNQYANISRIHFTENL